MLIVWLLTIGAAALALAQNSTVPPVTEPDNTSLPIDPVPVNESVTVVFSQNLDPDNTPCR